MSEATSTSGIISCPCGAMIRLPEQSGSRSLRCPKCKAGIALTAQRQVLAAVPAVSEDASIRCAICQSGFAREEFVVRCPLCDQVHHRDCWAEVGGCGTYGCKEAAQIEKPSDPNQPGSAWGDTKVCPYCKEKIPSIATRCRFCNSTFDTVDPLTLADMRRKSKRREELKAIQWQMAGLFAAAILLFCLAPLMAIVSLAMVLPRRREIAEAGPLFLVMGYAAIGLSVFYTLGMVLVLALQ